MKVLLASAEVSPWAVAGATGPSVSSLARGLQALGIEAVLAVPDYPALSVRRGKSRSFHLIGGAWTEAEAEGLHLALVQKREYFDRAGIYGAPETSSGTALVVYDDNLARFGYFARAVGEIAAAIGADVIHGLDWPGALVAVFGTAQRPATLGLSNFLFQGIFSNADLARLNPRASDWGKFEFYGRANALRAGLLSASAVVLPGERMARAVQSPGAGCGLEVVASEVAARLKGILSGADYRGWFDARSGARKGDVRRAWLAAAKLAPLEEKGLLIAFAPGLCGGRGHDLLLPVFDRLMEFPVRLAMIGQPPLHLAPAFQLKSMRYPGQFAIAGDDLRAAAAAADVILIPDALEAGDTRLACAMRSGAVPVAQWCSGLQEIVRDHDPAGSPGNGLIFYSHSPEALWDSFVRALILRREGAWPGLQERAASADFSWEAASVRYAQLFSSCANRTRPS